MIAETVKRCYKCGKTKPAAGFYREPRRLDGLSALCRDCRRAQSRAYHRKAKYRNPLLESVGQAAPVSGAIEEMEGCDFSEFDVGWVAVVMDTVIGMNDNVPIKGLAALLVTVRERYRGNVKV